MRFSSKRARSRSCTGRCAPWSARWSRSASAARPATASRPRSKPPTAAAAARWLQPSASISPAWTTPTRRAENSARAHPPPRMRGRGTARSAVEGESSDASATAMIAQLRRQSHQGFVIRSPAGTRMTVSAPRTPRATRRDSDRPFGPVFDRAWLMPSISIASRAAAQKKSSDVRSDCDAGDEISAVLARAGATVTHSRGFGRR